MNQVNKGVIDVSKKGTYTLETEVDISNSVLFTPSTISIVASTENNKVDLLSFGLSYVHMTKFKMKGTIRNKEKRRLRNYYEIKMGRNNNGTPVIKVPVEIKYTVLKDSRVNTINDTESNLKIDSVKVIGSLK